jgi:hypothetical protein
MTRKQSPATQQCRLLGRNAERRRRKRRKRRKRRRRVLEKE